MTEGVDRRRFSAACERNREPILGVLREVLPPSGHLLEIASGTGMHAAYMAPRLPDWTWQPSDASRDALPSITAWRAHAGVENLLPPLHLDVMSRWPVTHADAILNANMIHIAPWATASALFAGAAAVLSPGGPLVLYGPFFVEDEPNAEGNLRFDASLRRRDPSWGIRERADVIDAAAREGLVLDRDIPMPANNRSLVFRRP